MAASWLLEAILQEWPSYLACLVSFATIGAVWIGHATIGPMRSLLVNGRRLVMEFHSERTPRPLCPVGGTDLAETQTDPLRHRESPLSSDRGCDGSRPSRTPCAGLSPSPYLLSLRR